jgi:hypothetical protein
MTIDGLYRPGFGKPGKDGAKGLERSNGFAPPSRPLTIATAPTANMITRNAMTKEGMSATSPPRVNSGRIGCLTSTIDANAASVAREVPGAGAGEFSGIAEPERPAPG